MAQNEKRLRPYLSQAGAWAFSLGTAVGWGSLVVTANTYLFQAGPLGSVLGLLLGAAVMLVIAGNYHYMMNCFPQAGGAYAYSREMFGYDHGFLTGWFLMLTYLAILWANATALPLFARYFLGNGLKIGYLYTIFGYEVYLGEALVSVAALLVTAALCARFQKIMALLMVILVVLFTLGIGVCFAGSVLRTGISFAPEFVPDESAMHQVLVIACMSPWAFIGFENISHMTEEFTFAHKKAFRIMAAAVITAAALYCFVFLLSVSAYPPEYESWLAYIRDLDQLEGLKALPAFYAAEHYLGGAGVGALMIALLALVITSLIGNMTALSRLLYAMAKDRVLSDPFARVNGHGIPGNAVWLVAALSVLIPFLGRTAIGWIVDVTSLGATLIYGFVCACALKMALHRKDTVEKWTGLAGLVVMVGYGGYLLIPDLLRSGSMEVESYFLFAVWSILGFLFFHRIMRRDRSGKFGNSIVVWLALLSLVLFISLVWMSQASMEVTEEAMENIQQYYVSAEEMEAAEALGDAGMQEGAGAPDVVEAQGGAGASGTVDAPGAAEVMREDGNIVLQQLDMIRRTNARSIVVVIVLFAISLGVMLNNYILMRRRMRESEEELSSVKSIANTDPLTGVKSKHAYAEKEAEMNAALRNGTVGEFSIVVCDVNGLKYVNDTLGHVAGDEYIRSAARMICEIYQHSPVFRTGGDEFVAVLTGRDRENRSALMEALQQKSMEHICSKEVVVSAGMADYHSAEDENVHVVFERADARMYENKKYLKSLGARTRG